MERRRNVDHRAAAVWLTTITLLAWNASARAQDAVIADFKQNCASCHTIGGGRITGPDLRNVEERKERAWLVGFVQDPQGVIASGDAYALELKQEARGTGDGEYPVEHAAGSNEVREPAAKRADHPCWE